MSRLSASGRDSDESLEDSVKTVSLLTLKASDVAAAGPRNSRRLVPIEVEKIKQLSFLYKTWGYRAGEDQDHILFEDKSHRSSALLGLQDYTDIIFRNIQQVCVLGGVYLHETDTTDKLDRAMNFVVHFEFQQEVRSFLVAYFKNKRNLKGVLHLASIRPDSRRSKGFLCMIVAARAILCLYRGDFKKAHEHVKTNEFIVKDEEEEIKRDDVDYDKIFRRLRRKRS
jgi:hypothetical protein